jgi:benzodiazapine receptor
MNLTRSLIGLGVWIGVCFGAAFVGAMFTIPSVPTWYSELAKPSWIPPSWIFGPVWSALYLMMALAAWLVWRRGGLAVASIPISFFMVQLGLNVMWSILFFEFHMPGIAFWDIVILWFAVLATAIAFWRSTPLAGYLLVPYLFWVTFAAVLNFALWQLNT